MELVNGLGKSKCYVNFLYFVWPGYELTGSIIYVINLAFSRTNRLGRQSHAYFQLF